MKKCILGLTIIFMIQGSLRADPLPSTLSVEYSRGNDDLAELNFETARLFVELEVKSTSARYFMVRLNYRAVFSTDHPHNRNSDRYWLKQRHNSIEPNLTAEQLSYTPGPNGTSLGGKAAGSILLGEFLADNFQTHRGQLALTLMPDYDPSIPTPIDSYVQWGFVIENGVILSANLSLHGQWKAGQTRPVEEMLRLVKSNFIGEQAWRDPFAEYLPN